MGAFDVGMRACSRGKYAQDEVGAYALGPGVHYMGRCGH